MPWRRQRRSWVAVDRGACSLRAVQLVFGPDGPFVAHWVNVEAPSSSQPAAGSGNVKEASSDAGAAPPVASLPIEGQRESAQAGAMTPSMLAAGLEQFGTA